MSLKQKFFSTVTLAFAIVAFTTFVSAQNTTINQQDSTNKQERRERKGRGDKGMRGEHRGGKMMMRGLEKLNLTDAQKTQIRTLMENNRASNQGSFQEMRELKMKKRDGIITAEEQTRMKQLKTQQKAVAEQTHSSVMAILTAEQRAQLEQMKEQRKQEMQERRQNRQNRQSSPAQTEDN